MRRLLPRLTLLGACLALGVLLLLPAAASAKTTAHRIASHHSLHKSVAGPGLMFAQALEAPAQATAVIHRYTPFDIRWAYGLNSVGDPTTGTGLLGQGQTIVLLDSYGSPTAAQDLQFFHDTYYPNLPDPSFEQLFPLGRPDYHNVAKGNGVSGPAAAAGWSGEATLDIEWSYAVAPLAHIVLVAVPPAETLGVQGFPNLMKAIDKLVAAEPPGTVFSQSFGISENTFGGAAKQQAARFDQTYQAGLAKGDTFFASSGDNGTNGFLRAHKGVYTTTPEGSWPCSSPYVTAVGGTQLQLGWTWNPTSDVPFLSDGSYNPAYFNSVTGGLTEVVWNESWLPAATGGGVSSIYPRPSWQDGVLGLVGDHRGYPDLSWNAAVNGGVAVYISAFPNYQRTGWHTYGGTSSSSPQVAAVIALANEQQAPGGHPPIGDLNPLLYQVGASSAGATAFRDILPAVQGTALSGKLVNNTMFQYNADGSVSVGPVPGYPVLTGWDLTTGWGSPLAPAFIEAITDARNAMP
jgi:subtilase family serine protease